MLTADYFPRHCCRTTQGSLPTSFLALADMLVFVTWALQQRISTTCCATQVHMLLLALTVIDSI
jgi:hypothetical protein